MTHKEQVLSSVLTETLESGQAINDLLSKSIDSVKVISIDELKTFPQETDCSDWEKWTEGMASITMEIATNVDGAKMFANYSAVISFSITPQLEQSDFKITIKRLISVHRK